MNLRNLLRYSSCLLAPMLAAGMTNQDVIKMHMAGLSDETIVSAIRKEPKEYATGATDLIGLKDAGVSEKVIQAILATENAAPVPPSAAPTPSPRVPAATQPSEPPPSAAPEPAVNGAAEHVSPVGPEPVAAASEPASSPAPEPSSTTVPEPGPTASEPAPAPAAQAVHDVFQQDFPSIAPPFTEPVVGQNYFTRYTFHAEGGEHITTNYARGAAIPINTPVTLVSKGGTRLVIRRVDTGDTITFKNEEKYSRKSIDEIARLLLSSEKTPLERLPEEVATAVKNGQMRKGMTKELVLMTRGYPPAHETPSPTTDDRWVYWSSRFIKQTIVFGGGRLVEGRLLR